MKAKDLSISLAIGFGWVLLANILNGIYTSPDLSSPSIATKTTTTGEETTRNISIPSRSAGSSAILQILVFVFMGIVIIGVLYALYKVMPESSFIRRIGRSPGRVETMEKKVKSLSDARLRAKDILQKGLETGELTWAVIEAYRVLDKELDAFRAVARPKHWTPKEYAYHVSYPIHQPSIRGIVEIFYRIQYGRQNATKGDVLDFLLLLDAIFTEEITPTLNEKVSALVNKHDLSYDEVLIPRVADFTKPFMPGGAIIEKENDKDE